MQWKKIGNVYCPSGSEWWKYSHAMIPTPLVLNNDVVRVFITSCDEKGIGRVGYVDVNASAPNRVVAVSKEPVLDIGCPGTFDENGALVCSVVKLPDQSLILYYAGFEIGTKIRYRLLTGAARSDSAASKFKRVRQTPVLERNNNELFFRCGPFVLCEDGRFRMWYVAGSDWVQVGDATKPVYDIRYLESDDGINWADEGIPCITVEKDNEYGFGRPYVVRDGSVYRMFYSVRRWDVASYRLGYAESFDGVTWERKDNKIGIDVAVSGWDSDMICYSAVICLKGRWYMFYNGNDFGRTGFGVAELIKW